jgi:hypothetical protein
VASGARLKQASIREARFIAFPDVGASLISKALAVA